MSRSTTPLLLLLPLALIACAPVHAATAAASLPIHVSQTELDLEHGRPAVEHEYRDHLAACHKLTVPIKPLDAATVGKLGRTYHEAWYEGERTAVRSERWSFAVDGLCGFRPVRQRWLWIAGPRGTQSIDLDHGTGHFDANLRVQRAAPQVPKAPADDALKAAVAAQLQQQGQADVMAHDAGHATLAGQPCHRVRDATEDLCIWSGGARWGFDETVPGGPFDAVLSRLDSIVLSARPADGGDGAYLTTQKMTVGDRFDEGVFQRPAGVAMDSGAR
jgi:hypothetical protein